MRIAAAMLVAAAAQMEQASPAPQPAVVPQEQAWQAVRVRRYPRNHGHGGEEVVTTTSKAPAFATAAPAEAASSAAEPREDPRLEQEAAAVKRHRIGAPAPPKYPPLRLAARPEQLLAKAPAPMREAGPAPGGIVWPPPPVPPDRQAERLRAQEARGAANDAAARRATLRTPSRSPPKSAEDSSPRDAEEEHSEPVEAESLPERIDMQLTLPPGYLYIDGAETSEEEEAQQDSRRSDLEFTEALSRKAIRALRYELDAMPHMENAGVYATTLARYLKSAYPDDVHGLRTSDVGFLGDWDRDRFETVRINTGHEGTYEKQKTVIRATRRINPNMVPGVDPRLPLDQPSNWIYSEREKRQAANRCAKRRAKDRAADLKRTAAASRGGGKGKHKGKGKGAKGKNKTKRGRDQYKGKGKGKDR